MRVYTTLLTATPDPQRGVRWTPDPGLVERLARSVEGHDLFVLHDEDPISDPSFGEWVRIERHYANPYFDRWRLYADHLAALTERGSHAWTREAWCVDASDVEMLRVPRIPTDDGAMWTVCAGSELMTIDNQWLRDLHPESRAFIDAHGRSQMLNAGLLGGDAAILADIAREIAALAPQRLHDTTDMAAFNEVLYAHAEDLMTGPPVHTVYKAEDHDNAVCWWRHK